MATFSNNLVAKSGKNGTNKYICEVCDYVCFKKYNWDKHLMTLKHIEATKCNESTTEKWQKHTDFCCENCGKEYADRTGLWRHKKKCMSEPENQIIEKKENKIMEKDELIQFLINENKEFKQMMIEMAKNSAPNNCYNNTNSNNKTFNLQVFLNETCKDAMNIMDFVNSMEINLDDLEKVGELGYVNGMTNIIIKNLRALDITKRPLHCTDVKREIIYVKDDDKWEKENENKDKIKKALKYIVHKNAKMFNVFKEKYPDCIKSYSKRSDQYNKLVIEVLGGRGDNEAQHNDKIIRRIAREVTISK